MFRLWKPRVFLTGIVLLVSFSLPAQQTVLKSAAAAEQTLAARGEVIIRFKKPGHISISDITSWVSVDDFRNDTIIAYVNEKGYREFLKRDIPFDVIQAPSLQTEPFTSYSQDTSGWHHRYPAYSTYLELMSAFETDYPDLCRLTEFGTSIEGRRLLALKITDNPDEKEKEPVVLYTSTMHGDEPLGYVLMLRLIEYLLAQYNSDDFVRDLVNHMEIWINPLSNPDGTYFISDTSVTGSTRFNRNQVDLNRDFPDIRYRNWDSVQRQPETVAMMHFMESIKPVLAANFHSGAELVNYPWDTWYSSHADNAWYRRISRAYADTAHAYSPDGYLTDLDNGITKGNDWYPVYGGRQDYVNYVLRGREVTIELSQNKIPPEIQLDGFWNYNQQSLLHYMRLAMTGITGEITDSSSGRPLLAQIRIINHDRENSSVFSYEDNGVYYRMVLAGEYTLRFSSPGYISKNAQVRVNFGEPSHLDIRLTSEFEQQIYPNPFTDFFYLNIPYAGFRLDMTFIDLWGRKVKMISQPVITPGKQTIIVNGLMPGYYIVHVTYNLQSWELNAVRTPE